MILFLPAFLVYFGTVAPHEADYINRVHLIPQENYSERSDEYRTLERDSVHRRLRTNDYVDRSSRVHGQPPPLPKQIYDIPSHNPKNTPLRVHQPKEDPRTFYQSDVYLQEIDGQNINKEVTFIYPGKEVNRASEKSRKPMSLRAHDRHNIIGNGVNICVRCPHDRTLVARPGADRVFFQYSDLRLLLCSGQRAPKSVRFVQVYGPKFGSLIERGTHLIVGRIMYKDKSVHMCKMHVHVITQSCATPKNLKSHCTGQNCTFACRNPHNMELQGQSALQCGSDMKWIGELPYCRARTRCVAPTQLENVRKISCHTPNENSAENSIPNYIEGTKCRIRCKKGWRWYPRAVSVCRRGEWTIPLDCYRITKRRNKKFPKS
ncbi:hypothetical protein NE865_07048 [Phthorimaea operculella]|nr:hypothetical protein NE865_07048 [Phthorimaea operculella]